MLAVSLLLRRLRLSENHAAPLSSPSALTLQHQSMTKHLLKTPDERKQPSRNASTTGSASIGLRKTSQVRVGGKAAAATAVTAAKSTTKGGGAAAKWAVTELLDVSDFEALVPRPAHLFPFTLDGFQKQAVARLEVSRPTI